ncbi:MAG: HNH endonuclease, partial [Salinibacterium sp.]|nr:HNH endonuclease [Salinibacterium sp.]
STVSGGSTVFVGGTVLVERLGYTSPTAAVASIARISERSARARLHVATAVCPDRSITGAPLPASRPVLSEALGAGEVGLDAAALIATELASIAGRAPAGVLAVAESVMVQLAIGVSSTGQPMAAAVSVDFLAGEIRQVTAAADPDGARPREERAVRRREFRLGAPDEDGLVPANGRLMPELGSLLAGLLEAHRRSPRFVESDASLSSVDDLAFGADPRTADPRTPDPRTPGQRRHDAFGEILMAAAAAEGAPRLDGQSVTVLVTVSAADLADRGGLDADPIGTMAGSPFPISRRAIERFIDAGGYRVVTTDEHGAVTAISSPQRCFTPIQRLGIAARDGSRCSTPGCTSPHYTLQAHHVIPDRDDGPTAIDNGILLCYWHHQLVDTGPWQYRMVDGMPRVRGPGIPEWTATRMSISNAA